MPSMPSFGQVLRFGSPRLDPPPGPPAKKPGPTLSPLDGGLASHLGRRGGGDGGGLFTPIKVRAPEVTRARRRPGNPPPTPPPPRFYRLLELQLRGGAPPRLPPALCSPALPPRPGPSVRRGAGPGRAETHHLPETLEVCRRKVSAKCVPAREPAGRSREALRGLGELGARDPGQEGWDGW